MNFIELSSNYSMGYMGLNDWVETRLSDWMVAMIDETSRKRKIYGEPSAKAATLKRICFVKKWV